MSEYQRGGRSYDDRTAPALGHRAKHELTPDEKAQVASTIASNLEHAHSTVVSSLESLWHAHEAHDLPAYLKARAAAELAVERVRDLASGAKTHALDASD